MSDTKRIRLVRKGAVRAYHGRGPIYAWLRTHHKAIALLTASQPHLWIELALDMADDGVSDGAGECPDRRNVRKVWLRVARDVTAHAKAKADALSGVTRKKSKMPSRVSPDWRPIVVPQGGAQRPGQSNVPVRVPPAQSGTGNGKQVVSYSQKPRGPFDPPLPMDAPYEFPAVDPSGAPLPAGLVWFRGEPTELVVAERLGAVIREGEWRDWKRR